MSNQTLKLNIRFQIPEENADGLDEMLDNEDITYEGYVDQDNPKMLDYTVYGLDETILESIIEGFEELGLDNLLIWRAKGDDQIC